VPLDALGIPLVGGIKHLPVRFTPTAPSAPRSLRATSAAARPESISRRTSSRLETGVAPSSMARSR
jgi:hypothetical protein